MTETSVFIDYMIKIKKNALGQPLVIMRMQNHLFFKMMEIWLFILQMVKFFGLLIVMIKAEINWLCKTTET